MNTKGTVIILFLCFLTLFSSTDSTKCINVLEGDDLTFILADDNNPLGDNDRFTVIKDNTFRVPKRRRNEKGPGIVEGNSLKFKNVGMSESGKYTIEVFDDKGTNKKSYSETVCVYAKVQKPILNITCLETKVAIRCEVKGNVTFEKWHKNGKDFKEKINFTTTLDDTAEYTCTAKNPLHNNTSEPLRVACAMKLFGFDFWIMVGILAGGGSLVLLLVLLMVICSCRACKRREKQQRDEEELRLNYHNLSQQKSKQTARGQPAPPEPYDDVSAQDIPSQAQPKPRSQPRGRPPPPPIDDDEEQPPPLPQPRKNAQVKRHEEP